MKWCTNPSNCSSLASCRSSIQSHLCPAPLLFPEGIGQYIKSWLKLLSCWYISLMKSPSAAVLVHEHSSFAGANIHGVLGRAPVGWVLEPGPQRLLSLGSPRVCGYHTKWVACCCFLWLRGSSLGHILPRGSACDFSSSSTTLWKFLWRQVSCEIHTQFLLRWQRTSHLGFLLLSAFLRWGISQHQSQPTSQGAEAMNPLLPKRKGLGVETSGDLIGT